MGGTLPSDPINAAPIYVLVMILFVVVKHDNCSIVLHVDRKAFVTICLAQRRSGNLYLTVKGCFTHQYIYRTIHPLHSYNETN